MPNHVQHIQNLPFLIFYLVKSRGEPGRMGCGGGIHTIIIVCLTVGRMKVPFSRSFLDHAINESWKHVCGGKGS